MKKLSTLIRTTRRRHSIAKFYVVGGENQVVGRRSRRTGWPRAKDPAWPSGRTQDLRHQHDGVDKSLVKTVVVEME